MKPLAPPPLSLATPVSVRQGERSPRAASGVPAGSFMAGGKSTPQSSVTRSSFGFDESQRAVIECNDREVVAEARAGAGKTTTAIGYAQHRPDARILYVCLNKANQVEASARFGANTECRTSHSLAYSAVGYRYKNKLIQSWKTRTFQDEMRINDSRLAAAAKESLENYFHSSDREISENHLHDAIEKYNLSGYEISSLEALVIRSWGEMKSVISGVSIPHDAYLKMWALSEPKLSRKYSHIILDEAQDTNPVTAGVVANQRDISKLLIGDRHQSIYLFRGATNAMEEFANSGATVLTMPKTWRFGPEIADAANALLAFFKGEEIPIIGAGPAGQFGKKRSKALLSRTNAGLFTAAAALSGRGVHWVGGVESYRLDQLMSSYHLKCGNRNMVTDPVIRMYPSWIAYCEDAEATKDAEARMLIKFNEEYQNHVPYLISQFRQHALPTQDDAKLVLATAHKAKGLDWDCVEIGEDFKSLGEITKFRLENPMLELSPQMAQEVNLYYVAWTRARREIKFNEDSSDFLKNFPEYVHHLSMEVMRQTSVADTPAY